MKLSRREMALSWLTLLCLLSLLLALTVSRRWEEGRREAATRQELRQRVRDAKRLLGRRAEMEARLQQFLGRLPDRPAGQDVTADLLRDLERCAREQNVTLTRREADRERRVGDVFEVSITATWESDLESLVTFLHTLETQGVMRQIRQLTVSAAKDSRLKGSVVVDHAYTRSSVPASPKEPTPDP